MIPYMVGKLAQNSSHLTRGLVKYVSGRGYFRTVTSQNGDKIVTSPPPPPIIERVGGGGNPRRIGTHIAREPGVVQETVQYTSHNLGHLRHAPVHT